MSGTRLAVVAIGRNEGERLARCLRSLQDLGCPVVYVDSGSTDGSVETARATGVDVVVLTPDRPFTAARGRNAGLERVVERDPELTYVQFIDGDCELEPQWLETARAYLDARPEVAVVCGRRREVDPGRSVYNRLIDMEWDGIPGPVLACGGDAFVRIAAFVEVGGYHEALIAGEDPELCFRIRQRGHHIVRLPDPMTRHDAALTELRQWIRRGVRAGHAYAERFTRHREPTAARRLVSVGFWACLLPVMTLAASLFQPAALVALPAGYGLLALRIVRRRAPITPALGDRVLYAFACVLGKFAELYGAARYAWGVLSGRAGALIEYKGPRTTS